MPVKIASLELENVKRVKAVTIEPSPDGLTIVGGRNGQGKTSVLDAIAWALGGDRFRPSDPQREGSITPPHLSVTLSNGLVVERKGAKSSLTVKDPSGGKAGQSLVNGFIEQLALDLPRFMQSSARDKAKTLLQVIGVGERLFELEDEEQRLYNKRHEVGQIRDQKRSAAEESEWFPDAPAEPVSASELIRQQQEILAKNGENQRKREQVNDLKAQREGLRNEVVELERRLEEKRLALLRVAEDLEVAEKTAEQLADESTAEIEESIADIDSINNKVRINQLKALLDDEANEYATQYQELTERIDSIRAEKLALLEGADLPLPELGVEAGELVYRGHRWDSMSGSEQLKVATAIVRKINPECGFVLMDKLEQMDLDTLSEFGEWLSGEGLQVIATRVSTGGECSVVIEDGMVAASDKSWKEGEF